MFVPCEEPTKIFGNGTILTLLKGPTLIGVSFGTVLNNH